MATRELSKNVPETLSKEHLKDVEVVPNRGELLSRLPKNGYVAEMGVDEGNFSSKILNRTDPEKLYLVDPWDSKRYGNSKYTQVKNKFAEEIKDKRVEILRMRSEHGLRKFADNELDWVYIDTTHSYEQTLKELILSQQKVQEDGFITGHDYCVGNPSKYLNYGVMQAVAKFCVDYNWKIRFLTLESDGFHSFALTRL